MTMSQDGRIPALSFEESKAAAESVQVPEYMSQLNIFRVLLKHPELGRLVNGFLHQLLFKGKLDVRLRELMIMRIGWQTGSEYEWAQHWRVARDLGVSDEDVLAVRDWESYEKFGGNERAVLAATDEVLTTGAVGEETWKACASFLNEEELIELLFVIANWNMVSQFLRSVEIPLEEGMAPWPPDGAQPTREK